MLRRLAELPAGFVTCEADVLGRIEGWQDLLCDSEAEPALEDFQVRLVGWRLPADLGEEVLLEIFRGASRRIVALIPRAGDLTLELASRSGDAVEGVQVEYTLRSGRSGRGSEIARIVRDSTEHDPSPAELFFRTLAEAAEANLELEFNHVFMD
jgi:hypothetical protein